MVPKLEPNLNPPVLPPLPPLGAASGHAAAPPASTGQEGAVPADQAAGAEGSRVEGAPADPERKMEVDANVAAAAAPADASAHTGQSTEAGAAAM